MQGPTGEQHEGNGCYLEVVPMNRLVWTSVLLPGFRPAPTPEMGFQFTAIVEFESIEDGTIYRATAMHRTEEDRKIHEQMGFQQGWNLALDQLLALI